jgi:curved DNA-binding protein CbpA
VSGEPDPYEILEVRPDASGEVIRAAYRTLARRYHPDASVGDASSPQMVIVNWAWEILGNAQRRLAYDREHGVLARPTAPTQGAYPPPTWSAPGGAGGPGGQGTGGPAGRPGGTGGAGGGSAGQGATRGTAGTGSPTYGTGSRSPGSTPGRPRTQRRGADGRVIEWHNAPDGTGGAGEPPGPPSGTVLPFGRFIAWSIGEIARNDPGYLDWLDLRPEGAPYHAEIEAALKRIGWRQGPTSRDRSSRWGR